MPRVKGLRVREVASILNQSDDTVRRLLEDGQISGRRDGHHWVIDGVSVANYLERLRAKQPQPPSVPTSLRNHLRGLVVGIISDRVMTQVELLCGPYRIVSLISTEAAEELNLQVGSIAVANVKATNVSISASTES